MRVLIAAAAIAASPLLACASAPPPDEACLSLLRDRGVAFREGPTLKGVRTPVTLDGARFSPRLYPRLRRPPEMDCQLAAALVEARPLFTSLGITQLDYSAAYDYRNRARSSKLSEHAAGLAIDVHVFHSGPRAFAVATSFERRPGSWRAFGQGHASLASCLGRPRTEPGRTLRGLACGLREDGVFRVIMTPDDNSDHRDHFHIEARPDAAERMLRPQAPPAQARSGVRNESRS